MKQNKTTAAFGALATLTLGVQAGFAQSAPTATVTTTTKTEVKTTEVKTVDAKSADAKAASTPPALPTITAAPGSPEEVAQLRNLVEALTSRLQGLEKAQKKTDETVAKNVPLVSSASKLPVTISGLLQFRGDQFNSQDGDASIQPDSFRLRRAELRVTAPQITSRVSGTIQIDFAKLLSTSSSSSTGINQSGRALQELQLSYLLRKARLATGTPSSSGAGNVPAVPNNIYIDAGQFKIPVGYEGDLVSSSAIPTVERALMFAARDPFSGGYGDVRDTGVQLRGTQGQFRYWLGVFNGLGERQNDTATSDTKSIVGRLAFSPRSIQGLTVGVSGARGNSRNTSTVGGLQQAADRDLLNLFANYQRNKWTARGEYLTGSSQRFPSDLPNFENDVSGYYALLGYQFTPKIEGVLRYDTFNFDRNLDNAAVRDIVLGVNYYIKGNNAKIQANIVRRSGGSAINSANGFSSGLAGQFGNDRTEFRVQAQVGF